MTSQESFVWSMRSLLEQIDSGAIQDKALPGTSAAEATRLDRTRFLWTITECERIWGDSAFRRAENGNWRGRGLLGMYDAEMLAVWNGREFTDQVEPSQAIDKTIELFYDAGFLNAVTVSTNTARKLDLRVSAVTDALFRSR